MQVVSRSEVHGADEPALRGHNPVRALHARTTQHLQRPGWHSTLNRITPASSDASHTACSLRSAARHAHIPTRIMTPLPPAASARVSSGPRHSTRLMAAYHWPATGPEHSSVAYCTWKGGGDRGAMEPLQAFKMAYQNVYVGGHLPEQSSVAYCSCGGGTEVEGQGGACSFVRSPSTCSSAGSCWPCGEAPGGHDRAHHLRMTTVACVLLRVAGLVAHRHVC